MTEPLVSFDNSSASAPHRGDSVGSCKVGADCNPLQNAGEARELIWRCESSQSAAPWRCIACATLIHLVRDINGIRGR